MAADRDEHAEAHEERGRGRRGRPWWCPRRRGEHREGHVAPSYHPRAPDGRRSHHRSRLRHRRRRGPALGRLPAQRVRRRSSRSSPPSSASRCSSRAPPASARPSWPRRCRRYLGRTLVRLQCYEGLDEAKALYEWNYRKQLLRIQAEADRHRLGGRPGGHLRRGVPARAPADDRDRLARAGRPADRRDRQDRPGVRGDAPRGPLGLPDLDPRARPRRGAHAARSCC